MLTKATDLMELFMRLFDTFEDVEPNSDTSESTLVSPMEILADSPVPLTDLLSGDGSILTDFLETFSAQNAPHLADAFAELSRLVAGSEEDFFLDGQTSTRSLEFTYPIV